MQKEMTSLPWRISLLTSASTTNAFSVPSSRARRLMSAMSVSRWNRRAWMIPSTQPRPQQRIHLPRALERGQVAAVLDDLERGARDCGSDLFVEGERRERVLASAQHQGRAVNRRQPRPKVGAPDDRLLLAQIGGEADALRHLE